MLDVGEHNRRSLGQMVRAARRRVYDTVDELAKAAHTEIARTGLHARMRIDETHEEHFNWNF